MNRSKGFTLVELAIVLVIIGIILGAVLKGQDLINNSKGKRVTSDMRGIEALLWTYYDRKGHWPGDCALTGVLGYSPTNASVPDAVADLLSNDPDATVDACDYTAGAPLLAAQDAIFSDLRSARVASFETPNIVLAKHVAGGSFRIGDATDGTNIVQVLVVYDIPAWMAKMIDVSIDGTETGDAGRVRDWGTADTGAVWPTDANNDQIVSMAYFFDKPLP